MNATIGRFRYKSGGPGRRHPFLRHYRSAPFHLSVVAPGVRFEAEQPDLSALRAVPAYYAEFSSPASPSSVIRCQTPSAISTKVPSPGTFHCLGP
ncbi:hypothetical protein CLV72_105224 [Allonocardiopsis opalescens]|uniref:Uncharacterized protein n=1 Tax=Allonocardiopsis opalescens TaxID=1144618 RepID=A0A2T0Q253_9ACTN|nr:hypothetical protein CLV72_105224 [Allonocardiopsis opalescens]